MVFVVDSSGSIRYGNTGGEDNWHLILEFVTDMIKIFDIGPSGTRIGLVMYSDRAVSKFYLNTFGFMDQVVDAVVALEGQFMGGQTNTSGGLRVMLEDQFNRFNGDRPDIKNIAVVITDGESNVDRQRTIPDAEAARSAGIAIFSIGVTNAVNEQELRQMSSMPQYRDQNYYMSAGFDVLGDILAKVASETCTAPKPTPAPVVGKFTYYKLEVGLMPGIKTYANLLELMLQNSFQWN